MPSSTYYLVQRGNHKFLHLNSKTGVFWGSRKDAFHFYSTEAAIQVSCGLTTHKAKIIIVECEEE